MYRKRGDSLVVGCMAIAKVIRPLYFLVHFRHAVHGTARMVSVVLVFGQDNETVISKSQYRKRLHVIEKCSIFAAVMNHSKSIDW